MIWQLVVVGLLVITAACYLGRVTRRAWIKSQTGCGGGCGCGHAPASTPKVGQTALISSEQLTQRLRKGS